MTTLDDLRDKARLTDVEKEKCITDQFNIEQKANREAIHIRDAYDLGDKYADAATNQAIAVMMEETERLRLAGVDMLRFLDYPGSSGHWNAQRELLDALATYAADNTFRMPSRRFSNKNGLVKIRSIDSGFSLTSSMRGIDGP